MIHYKRCSEVSEEQCYLAFKGGFSDYMIKFEISQENYLKRFFGPEGNCMEHSFIALEDERPIGLVMGGIRDFHGRKTMRCGTMCVIPEYRFRGVAYELFQRHQNEAIENHCQQMFLEVIKTNTPAVKFYKRIGYRKVYDLSYFFLEDMAKLTSDNNKAFDIDKIGMKELASFRDALTGLYINWQNEMPYIEKLENQFHYGIRHSGDLKAVLSINQSGQFYFLWVQPGERGKGMAKALLEHSVKKHSLEKIKTGFPNNALMESFLWHTGFARDKIAQFEMYLPL